ncbi:MAG TPA: type II toxin-antitoxin system VapC family toxin [Rudaea sp.]
MLAVDTNVVVRFLTRDDPKQSPLARTFVERNEVHLLSTVLLECEWVLRSAYRLLPPEIASLLRQFAGLPGVSVEQPEAVVQALDWFEQGMDFADALHLASCADGDTFVTFDRHLHASMRKAKTRKTRLL